jgi:hypothetical protein
LPNAFFGKRQVTAIREYLEMRRVHGDGPATPQEILEALKAGGYRFEAKSDVVALIGLRALLRKATTVFHKLPGTRTYGLLAWYPNAKAGKSSNGRRGRGAGKKAPAKAGRKRKKIAGPVLAIAASNGNKADAA